jgi:hypothetical protein
VLSGADTSQPAQSSAARRGVLAAVDDLEPNAVAGVQRHAESFGYLGQLWCDDELVGTVCGRCAHCRPPPVAIIAPAMLFRPIDAEWSHDPA